jgi:hypothetical protein
MGLIVKLHDEFGVVLEEIQDRKDLLGPYIPALRDETDHCLRFIDRWGNTYFNQLQMEIFQSEWDKLSKTVQESDKDAEVAVKKLCEQVRELALKCQKEPHLILSLRATDCLVTPSACLRQCPVQLFRVARPARCCT